jgi:two-component system response regulator (stage 0 sporulation protein F)
MYTLLVVEDQKGLRLLLQEVFHQDGLSVVMAATGIEALEQLRLVRPDLMLLDLKLPGLNGCTVLKEARRMYPLLPVIIMTAGYNEEHDSDLHRCPGVVEVLSKPFDLFRARRLVMSRLCFTMSKEV